MSDIAKITKLLHDDSLERKMAAVIVLGELCAGGPDVICGLLKALSSDVPALQRHAVSALSRIGANELALCAKDALLAPRVRLDALSALRLVAGSKGAAHWGQVDAEVADALIDIASGDDRVLAQSALATLATLATFALPREASRSLAKLIAHPELERARFVIDQLGRRNDEDATRALVDTIKSLDRRRAEFAAGALTASESAVIPLAEALLETKDADRIWLMRNILRPNAKNVPAGLRKRLLDGAMDRFLAGEPGWDAIFDVARDADPDAAAFALRDLAHKLAQTDRVRDALVLWRRLCASDRATDADRQELSLLERRSSIAPPAPEKSTRRVSVRPPKSDGRKPEGRKAAR